MLPRELQPKTPRGQWGQGARREQQLEVQQEQLPQLQLAQLSEPLALELKAPLEEPQQPEGPRGELRGPEEQTSQRQTAEVAHRNQDTQQRLQGSDPAEMQ